MTRHLKDKEGRRWKAWLASRDVFWPDPNGKTTKDPTVEAVLFVCFSDPNAPQKRIRLPEGSFAKMSQDDLMDRFLQAEPDPAIR